VLSQYAMTAQYAPSAQPMGVNATTRFPALYAKYVQPIWMPMAWKTRPVTPRWATARC
jgi:type 1 glutamine amidotransferase